MSRKQYDESSVLPQPSGGTLSSRSAKFHEESVTIQEAAHPPQDPSLAVRRLPYLMRYSRETDTLLFVPKLGFLYMALEPRAVDAALGSVKCKHVRVRDLTPVHITKVKLESTEKAVTAKPQGTYGIERLIAESDGKISGLVKGFTHGAPYALAQWEAVKSSPMRNAWIASFFGWGNAFMTSVSSGDKPTVDAIQQEMKKAFKASVRDVKKIERVEVKELKKTSVYTKQEPIGAAATVYFQKECQRVSAQVFAFTFEGCNPSDVYVVINPECAPGSLPQKQSWKYSVLNTERMFDMTSPVSSSSSSSSSSAAVANATSAALPAGVDQPAPPVPAPVASTSAAAAAAAANAGLKQTPKLEKKPVAASASSSSSSAAVAEASATIPAGVDQPAPRAPAPVISTSVTVASASLPRKDKSAQAPVAAPAPSSAASANTDSAPAQARAPEPKAKAKIKVVAVTAQPDSSNKRTRSDDEEEDANGRDNDGLSRKRLKTGAAAPAVNPLAEKLESVINDHNSLLVENTGLKELVRKLQDEAKVKDEQKRLLEETRALSKYDDNERVTQANMVKETKEQLQKEQEVSGKLRSEVTALQKRNDELEEQVKALSATEHLAPPAPSGQHDVSSLIAAHQLLGKAIASMSGAPVPASGTVSFQLVFQEK
jgi:hypothetical protein